MRRKHFIAAGTALLLVALYAAAGFWLAPAYLREALADAAQQRRLVLQVEDARTNPFTLRAVLEGVALRTDGGRTVASAQAVSAELAWRSLWQRDWVVESARLESPVVELGALPPAGTGAGGSAQGQPTAVKIENLAIENGVLRHAPSGHALEALSLHAQDLSTLDAAAGTYEATARVAGGAGQLSTQGTLALAPLAAQGKLSVEALRAQTLLPAARGQLQGSAGYTYNGGEFVLNNVAISGSDLAHAGVELTQATLRIEKAPLPPRAPIQAALEASAVPRGKLTAQGKVQLSPLELHLNVSAQELPLPLAQRWLPPQVALQIASGNVAATGLVSFVNGSAAYHGSATVSGLRLEERGSDALLLAWKEARTDTLALSFSPFSLEAGEIVARAPEGRLVIGEDGVVNFSAVFPPGDEEGGEPPRIALERLRIEEGTLHFADRTLANPFEVTLVSLDGTVNGFSTEAGDPAQVRLAGRVQPHGTARIRGTVDLNEPTQLADIRANLSNLPLQAFNPYVAKFAGYRIESGRLDARLRYRVRNGELQADNRLAFREMQLGEKLEERGLLDLPLDLVVALLTDANGRISLEIPVRGSLNDPQFDFGAIVAKALGNVVRKIVSAPFRALAGLFGGGKKPDESPGQFAFEPGSARLPASAEEEAARLAEGLAQRPQLGVQVHGAYDPQRDPGEAELHALARRRAEAVRRALIDHGVDASRVSVGEVREAPATEVALSAGGETLSAAAGDSADPLREAQRRLNALGYEAGAVDGMFGDRTKRALIIFQAVNELPLTGKLDAATRELLLR